MDQIVENAIKDPTYCPYCMRCPGLVRMRKVDQFLWYCGRCGAIHDARGEADAMHAMINLAKQIFS